MKNLTVNAGCKQVPVPLTNIGPVDAAGDNLNLTQSYTIELVRGDPRNGQREAVGNATLGGRTLFKPLDNIGNKSIANSPPYAATFMYAISIPGCGMPGRVFVGSARTASSNLGEIFDLRI